MSPEPPPLSTPPKPPKEDPARRKKEMALDALDARLEGYERELTEAALSAGRIRRGLRADRNELRRLRGLDELAALPALEEARDG